MSGVLLSKELAVAIRTFLEREGLTSRSTPAGSKLRRPTLSSGGGGGAIRQGKTTSAVTPLDDGPPIRPGQVTVQLYKEDGETEAWATDGDPVTAWNWSGLDVSTVNLICQVGKGIDGRWWLVSINCDPNDTQPPADFGPLVEAEPQTELIEAVADLTLPQGGYGDELRIKNVSAAWLYVTAPEGYTVETKQSISLIPREAVHLFCNGSEWLVV